VGLVGVNDGAVVATTLGRVGAGATDVEAGTVVVARAVVLEASGAVVLEAGAAVIELAVVARWAAVPQAARTRPETRTPTSTARPDIALLSQQLIVVGWRRTLAPQRWSPAWRP
jgi:hypothetical protein